jgi:hypothetical protein
MTLSYNQPLYILPFDHRGPFQTGIFGWKGALSPEQNAQIAAAKQVIYDGLKEAVAAGVPKDRRGYPLVDPCTAARHTMTAYPLLSTC